jgi:hypothetical protein
MVRVGHRIVWRQRWIYSGACCIIRPCRRNRGTDSEEPRDAESRTKLLPRSYIRQTAPAFSSILNEVSRSPSHE